MRSAQKKTPASDKKNGKEQTSGKKLIQARLPFKIVAGTVASPALVAGVVSSETETLPKKRKLSYDDESENPNKKIGKSESKENSTLGKDDKSIAAQDVIVLEDDDSEKGSEVRTPSSSKITKRTKKGTPHSAGKSNTPKVQIKLPLSGKKKRKKVDVTARIEKAASDSSDVEIVDEQNTQKKIKLSEDVESDQISTKDTANAAEESPEVVSSSESLECEIASSKKSPAKTTSKNTIKSTPVSDSKVNARKNAAGAPSTKENESPEPEISLIEKSPTKKSSKDTVKTPSVSDSKVNARKSAGAAPLTKVKESPEPEVSLIEKSPTKKSAKDTDKTPPVSDSKVNARKSTGVAPSTKVKESPEPEISSIEKSPAKKASKDTTKNTPVSNAKVNARKSAAETPSRNDNESPESETPSSKKSLSKKTSKDSVKTPSITDSKENTRLADKHIRSSSNEGSPKRDSADEKTPARQKNLRVSLKRVKSAKKKEIEKEETEPNEVTGEEQSLSQKSQENEEILSCEEISDTDGDLDKSTAADTSTSSLSKRLLTPKQIKLMEHRKKIREEKEQKLLQLKEEKNRKLQERERKLQEERLQKQKEREERELQRKKEREEKDEQKKREKEEKEEQRRKEKEDKERKRLAEVEAKNEEKRKRDEAKEEERRKKEEDRRRKELEKEEEENKKKKAAQAFTKFFVPKTVKSYSEADQESNDDMVITDCLAFRPFQVKGDMKLAPLVRRDFNASSRDKMDSLLKRAPSQNSSLYLKELKSGKHAPLKGSKTILKDNDDDIIIIENELETAAEAISEARPKTTEKCRAKYFFFRENRRPPYYGTWRKKSSVITARRPFGTDKGFFDYEVDSDDEWEEEEPGESLNGSDEEKEESEDDDYEVDNEWFVPHGHLSDEELQNEDEFGPDTSREAQKAKLKALQQEFAQEMKKKTEKIKPRLFGAIWEDEMGNKPKLCPEIIWETLCARAMIVCETPLVEEPRIPDPEPSTPPPEKLKRLEINDDLMVALIRLVHGNRHSKAFLIKEYIEHVRKTCESVKCGECLAPTKSMIREKIDEISEWSVVDDKDGKTAKMKSRKKLCWVVSADVLSKYSVDSLGLKNEWSYTLRPKFDSAKESATVAEITDESPVPDAAKPEDPKSDATEKKKSTADAKEKKKSSTEANEKKRTSTSGITKFAKVLTSEEKKKNLSRSSFDANTSAKAASSGVSKTTPKVVRKPETEKASVSKTTPAVKKRVPLLMSVPPGQDFPAKSKNALISKFLETNKSKTSPGKPNANASSYLQTDEDDAVIIE